MSQKNNDTANSATPPETVVSSDTLRQRRLPPGQVLTAQDRTTGRMKWPILDAVGTPRVELDSWRLRLFGMVEKEVSFDWAEFSVLPRVKVFCDIHCVTRWSRLDNTFEGVAVRTILDRVSIAKEARFVVVHAHDDVDGDWTTNLPLDALADEDCVFATHHDGQPLTPQHGGPCRLVVPKLYFWKSAKWVKAVEFCATDAPGFWERNGYHMHGDPWTEERFRS